MSKNWDKGEEITAAKLNNQGLKVSAQDTPDLTVLVSPGVAIVEGVIVKYAGGNSPSITAPASNPRIDLIHIDSAGTIGRTAGVEGASPSAPAYPSDKTVLAEIYCKVGQTQIFNTDQGSGKGYIYRDSRPLGAGITLINTSAGASDAGKGVKTDASGLIDDTFMFNGFGDGSDGAATLDGSTDYNSWSSRSGDIYTMTRDVYFTNLTINSGKTLRPAGYRIYGTGTLTNNGTIQYNGNDGTAGTNDSSTAPAGGTAVSGFFKQFAGGIGGQGGTSGNNGSSGGTTGSPVSSLGGKGGNTYRGGGRNDTPDNSATGPTPGLPKMRFGTIRFLTIAGVDLNITTYAAIPQNQTTSAASAGTAHTHTYDSDRTALIPLSGGAGGAGGGGGHGYTASGSAIGAAGGGGGAGGGVIFIAFEVWAGNGVIEAKGGAGGKGANKTTTHGGGGSGGGGGGGGHIVFIYCTKTYTGSTSVAGGTGGALGTQVGGGITASAGDNGASGTVSEIRIGKAIV